MQELPVIMNVEGVKVLAAVGNVTGAVGVPAMLSVSVSAELVSIVPADTPETVGMPKDRWVGDGVTCAAAVCANSARTALHNTNMAVLLSQQAVGERVLMVPPSDKVHTRFERPSVICGFLSQGPTAIGDSPHTSGAKYSAFSLSVEGVSRKLRDFKGFLHKMFRKIQFSRITTGTFFPNSESHCVSGRRSALSTVFD